MMGYLIGSRIVGSMKLLHSTIKQAMQNGGIMFQISRTPRAYQQECKSLRKAPICYHVFVIIDEQPWALPSGASQYSEDGVQMRMRVLCRHR